MTNRRSSRQAQRGQSMTEFLLALAVLLPLFLLMTYLGRYGDVLQTTVQASRYAAFQRAMEPSTTRLSNATLEDQMRARFFVQGDYLNNGRLRSNDSAASLGDKGTPPMWRDLSLTPILKSPASVTLTMGSAPISTGSIATVMNTMTKSAGKSWPGAVVAQVDVTVFNKLDQLDSKTPTLKIGAATAAAGNGLGSSGSQATRDATATIVPTSYIPKALSGFLTLAMKLFEPSGPELGCIKPDVVPTDRLEPFVGTGACM